MNGATNDQLRQRYVLDELFTPDALVPHYTHFERLVVSGAAPVHG
jgi:4-deoxy-L-threo-5-hexosulose-uronate ketol-isomerase